MSQKRFLTPEEKDDEGNPLWTVQKKKVIVVPNGWEPNR